MFTRLRTIIGVRLLPLTASLLLSGCALHRQDARPDAAPSPAGSEEPVLPHVELPPIDVPMPEVTIPESGTAQPPVTRWVTHAPSFTLVSTSEVASDVATAALQATSLAFARLFGDQAPRIAVAIIDTSKGQSIEDIPEPPVGVTSIVMVVSGLAGPDSAAAVATLTSELRFEAATAWIFDYAQEWAASLEVPRVCRSTSSPTSPSNCESSTTRSFSALPR